MLSRNDFKKNLIKLSFIEDFYNVIFRPISYPVLLRSIPFAGQFKAENLSTKHSAE